MRVALDTNVLFAAIAAQGSCAELLEHCQREHEIVLSEYILDELRENLEERLGLQPRVASSVVRLIKGAADLVAPTDVPASACRDAADLPVLGTAVAGRCQALVTGDTDLLDLGSFQGIRILRPADFWRFEAGGSSDQDVADPA